MNTELTRIKKSIEYKVQQIMNYYDGDGSFYCDCHIAHNPWDEHIQLEVKLRVWNTEVATCNYIFKKDRTDTIIGDYNIIKIITNNLYRQLVDRRIEMLQEQKRRGE